MHNRTTLISQGPLLWYALAFAYSLGIVSHNLFFASVFCFVLLILCIFQNVEDKTRAKYLVLFSLLFYFIAYFYTFPHFSKNYTLELEPNRESTYIAHIDKVQSLQDKRLRLIISEIKDKISQKEISKKAVVYIDLSRIDISKFTMPLQGMNIDFKARFRSISFPKNTGIADASLYWNSQDIFYSAYLSAEKNDYSLIGKGFYLARLRQDIYQSFIQLCMHASKEVSQARAILIALIFGERFFINTETYQLFIHASLVHSIALSGMHLAFALLLSFIIVKGIAFIYPTILLSYPMRILVGFVSIPLALFYFWLGNAPISLLRASLMLILFYFFLFFYRKLSLLDCLILCASIILVFMPEAIVHLGFQFSVLSVLAIALFTPYYSLFAKKFLYNQKNYLSERKTPLSKKILFYFLGLFFISFVIQVFLLPLQVFVFGLISPYFILNIIWLPILQLCVLPFAFLSLFTMPFSDFSNTFLILSSSLTSFFIEFLQFLDKHEKLNQIQFYRFDIWQSIGYYLFILTALYYKRIKCSSLFFFLSFLCLFTFPLYKLYDNFQAQKEARTTIRVLNVGQGQSILIEYADKKFLVDAGGVFGNRFDTGRDTVAKVLTYRDMPKIDYAFVTHFDLDHAKGFYHLMKHFDISRFYYPFLDNKKQMRKEILELAGINKIKTIPLSASTTDIPTRLELIPNTLYFEVLSPHFKSSFSKANYSNNTSLVLRLIQVKAVNNEEKGLLLICGDIEEEGINALLTRKYNLKSEILILPHHGALSTYNEEFYKKVSPQIVVASTGFYNRFNFPSEKIVNYFTEKGIEVQNTAFQNERIFTFKN